MSAPFPFVVTVASEKGGVGKTTVATNLAVYLKALREELEVTVASFDNHFSVDNMFSIGAQTGRSVAGLFEGAVGSELAMQGEYGVQYFASDRSLSPPDEDDRRLGRALAASGLSGILVLDTRPVLDYFTRNALLAADLALVPVKDRPSLVNAASLKRVLAEGGEDTEKMWLLPSIIDGRLRLRGKVGLREFLAFSAVERGYQVLDTFIAKSPKVEGLSTGFGSRVYPVITHARSTVVHRQFRELAEFVLERFDSIEIPLSRRAAEAKSIPPMRARRLSAACPACGAATLGDEGHFFFDRRSRRRGYLHAACLEALLGNAAEEMPSLDSGVLVLEVAEAGLAGPEGQGTLHLFGGEGELVESRKVRDFDSMIPFCRKATGREPEEFHREYILITLEEGPPSRFLAGEGHERLSLLRRKVLREILAGG